ncbi:hypothetical protein GCM10027568_27300 [Humibacter soli]
MARRSHSPSRARTISDVAELAGVSLSTVSRVMNGSTTVDPALSERVRQAAHSLNYSASPVARSLVLGKTQTVAVVVPDLANPVFQGILRGLSAAAARQNYHVLVADSFENLEEERVLAVEARRRCDGIVLCAPRMPAEELEALLPDLGPVVLINRDSSTPASTVTADYRSGMLQLLEHLYSLGHRRIAYLPGSASAQSNLSRLSAIREFTEAHPDATVSERRGGVGFEDGHAAAEVVATSDDTAVLAYNDLVAMGLLSALTERGVRVPQDVSITGFDDIPFARYTTPPLTTASVPIEELGRQAWDRMWALLSETPPESNISFEPQLIARGSTGSVRVAD